jgi:hypothetical protein
VDAKERFALDCLRRDLRLYVRVDGATGCKYYVGTTNTIVNDVTAAARRAFAKDGNRPSPRCGNILCVNEAHWE